MKSFGRLLRQMRGTTPLEEIARRTRRELLYLQDIEARRLIPDAKIANQILMRGFELDEADSRRAILGIQLYDLGLKDNDIRQLVIAVINGVVPEACAAELRRLYREYVERV